jgi:GNAT superfamily N-acetyltransferase
VAKRLDDVEGGEHARVERGRAVDVGLGLAGGRQIAQEPRFGLVVAEPEVDLDLDVGSVGGGLDGVQVVPQLFGDHELVRLHELDVVSAAGVPPHAYPESNSDAASTHGDSAGCAPRLQGRLPTSGVKTLMRATISAVSIRVSLLGRADLEAARALFAEPWRRVAEEKLFGGCPPPAEGVALGAWEGERLVGVAAAAARWLRVIAVAAEARGRGVGSALLAEVAARARAGGETRLRVGDQPGNYLTPGVDAGDAATLGWLERRGFRRVGENENLRVPLASLPEPAAPAGYELRRARPDEGGRIGAWIEAAFGRAWAFETARALEGQPAGVHLALRGGEPAAFACHDGNNRGLGWFGPAGTLPEHRGRGLGEALLLSCLRDVREAGHREGVIAWIGPRAFYEKTVGARPGPRFVTMERAP